MAPTVDDLLDAASAARQHFLKHLHGVRPEQWDWKPYPECKSLRETLAHLIQDDYASLESLKLGRTPDYAAIETKVQGLTGGADLENLHTALERSHAELCGYVRTRFSETPLDSEVTLWGMPMKLWRALGLLTSEDYYHAGQVAYVRLATDPEWDYYGTIYGNSPNVEI